MAAPPALLSTAAPGRLGARQATRRKADAVLVGAASLIAGKGFEATTLRDVGRELDVSLGGMYYYFSSKDDLLFQIQQRTFSALLAAQVKTAAFPGRPEQRLERLLVGHLAFFEWHPNEMKICTFELESLKGAQYRQILLIRRRYYRLMAGAVAALTGSRPRKGRDSARSRHLTLFIFGMLNWAFMWYRPAKDGPVDSLAAHMIDLIQHGVGKRATG